MRLADTVAAAVADRQAPAVALALIYAERIDEASHTSLGLAAALDTLQRAASVATEAGETGALEAFRKVAAAVSAVTVASDLGPKLLATFDALLLTPKAKAAAGQALAGAAPASPLARLRERHDGRRLRAVS